MKITDINGKLDKYKEQSRKIKRTAIKKTKFTIGLTVITAISMLQLAGLTTSISARFADTEDSIAVSEAVLSAADRCSLQNKDEELIPSRITISKAHIDLPVVTVSLSGGTWQVNEGVANYAKETATISEKDGNVGIYAHDRENGFSGIKTLVKGDVVEVTAGGYKALYKVSSAYNTSPTNVETFYPTSSPTLTLVTCDGIFSDQRFVIKAELVSIEKGSCYAKSI